MILLIPTHKAAGILLSYIRRALDFFGLQQGDHIEQIIYSVLVILIGFFVGWALRWIIIAVARKILALRRTNLSRSLLQHHIVSRCSHILPPLTLMTFIPFSFTNEHSVRTILMRVVIAYGLVCLAVGINAIISFLWDRFESRDNRKKHPLRGILNTLHGIVWIIIAICAISVLVDRSPAVLLTGLTAFAAALMLIFKDSILGFVAGLQLSQNDMLRVGDWIAVPSTIANGIVTDVSLTVVKVQNWDNTTVMLPPYTLVSTSFQNYRGMSDSGSRRILQNFMIDMTTIFTATDQWLDQISEKMPLVASWIATQRKNRSEGKPEQFNGGNAPINGTIDTNLGVFRAYLCLYLSQHPMMHIKGQYLMVRLQPTTEVGVPLQIYCFTTTEWLAYEAVQSQIMEHVITVAPLFGLTVYNTSDGNEMTVDLKMLDPDRKAAAIAATAPAQAPSATAADTAAPAPQP
ncbi:MAG: mechanosensitive ion channel family protein [Muribaculaceae bacterium]|nr:mechanosensitive ion channel family protein [Muribaculaceae bacterium]